MEIVQEWEHRIAGAENRLSSLEQYITGKGGLFVKLDAMEKKIDALTNKMDEFDSRLQKVELCMEANEESRKPVTQMFWNIIGQIIYGIVIAGLTLWLAGR